MTSTAATTGELVKLLDYAGDRIFERLKGLTDAEYFWEPVPSGLSVRPDASGVFRADPVPEPDPVPAPVPSIAWRMWHIGADCLRGYCVGFFGSVDRPADPHLWPGTADEGIEAMRGHWAQFRADVVAMDDEALMSPMGPRARQYADDTYAALVLHALDEVIHHGAELGLLRDLYGQGFGHAAGPGSESGPRSAG